MFKKNAEIENKNCEKFCLIFSEKIGGQKIAKTKTRFSKVLKAFYVAAKKLNAYCEKKKSDRWYG